MRNPTTLFSKRVQDIAGATNIKCAQEDGISLISQDPDYLYVILNSKTYRKDLSHWHVA